MQNQEIVQRLKEYITLVETDNLETLERDRLVAFLENVKDEEAYSCFFLGWYIKNIMLEKSNG